MVWLSPGALAATVDRTGMFWEIGGPGPDIIIHIFLFALLMKCSTAAPSYTFSYGVNCGPKLLYGKFQK